MYQVQLQETKLSDTLSLERAVVTCQPPGQTKIVVPDPTEIETANENSARHEMHKIKEAYETFHVRNLRWPKDQTEMYELLGNVKNAFQSPWPGVMYQVQLQEVSEKDGTIVQHPVVTCQPHGRATIRVPDTNTGKMQAW
jgi:hypothetical protein